MASRFGSVRFSSQVRFAGSIHRFMGAVHRFSLPVRSTGSVPVRFTGLVRRLSGSVRRFSFICPNIGFKISGPPASSNWTCEPPCRFEPKNYYDYSSIKKHIFFIINSFSTCWWFLDVFLFILGLFWVPEGYIWSTWGRFGVYVGNIWGIFGISVRYILDMYMYQYTSRPAPVVSGSVLFVWSVCFAALSNVSGIESAKRMARG